MLSLVRAHESYTRGHLLGSAVRVGPQQFPRVFALTQRCADTLKIVAPRVYITNNHTMNAMTYGTEEDAFILIHSGLIDHLSDTELLDVIGHECGHLHNNHVVYLTTLYLLQHLVGEIFPPFSKIAVIPLTLALNAWRRRAEITCDRAGLLCSRDMEAATKSLAKLALGSHKLYEQLNLEAFIAQNEESLRSPGRLEEFFSSHPWLPKRILALKLFAQSALYRKHAGLGDDGLSMQEVDDQVERLVRVFGDPS